MQKSLNTVLKTQLIQNNHYYNLNFSGITNWYFSELMRSDFFKADIYN